MKFGTETEIKTVDDSGSTEELIIKLWDGEPRKTLKKYAVRIKVNSKHDEMTEYLHFTDMLEQKQKEGVLFCPARLPDTYPSFVIEYPSKNYTDYFIIHTHTEIVI